ncbi:MAG TPA: hypothetical protein VJ809_18265 [Pirellulales bacterium]|nr:hypothetical protein [Pirellulales bacterium]
MDFRFWIAEPESLNGRDDHCQDLAEFLMEVSQLSLWNNARLAEQFDPVHALVGFFFHVTQRRYNGVQQLTSNLLGVVLLA